MNWDQVQGNWQELKGKAHEKWAKLTDRDVDWIAGKKDQLIGALKTRYGLERERAMQEIDVFGQRLGNLMLGHDAPIDPLCFPVTSLDLKLLECPPIRQILGVFDGACALKSAALVMERDVKVRCHHDGLLGFGVYRVLDTEVFRDGKCVVYWKKWVLLADVGDHKGPL